MDNTFYESWSKYCISSYDNLLKYLHVAAVVPEFSLDNQLCVLAYTQERLPTMIKSMDDWNAIGVTVNENPLPIYIKIAYVDENNTIIGYNDQQLYDAVDTSFQYVKMENTAEQALEALLTDDSVPIVVVDELKRTKARALYAPAEKTIYVVRSNQISTDEFFLAIAKERCHAICHANMKDISMNYNRAMYDFACCTVAYGIAKANNVNTDSMNISGLPERWIEMGGKGARKELQRMNEMNKKIACYLQHNLRQIYDRDRSNV